MLISVCKSKIHRARITETNLHYEGSITIDETIMQKSGILPFEKVQVVNLNNGLRFDTYVIKGNKNSGVICLNGPSARLGQAGDLVIIISYALVTKEQASRHKPKLVYLDNKNRIKKG